MPTFLQSNFNGEWSPLMLGRVEMARYGTAVRTMENFAPTITGGARKRPGTDYLGGVQDSARMTRLATFSFSNDQAYLFEFGHEILRFWRDGALLVDTEVTPYSEDEVFGLRMTSTNDIVYIASGSHWPQELVRTSDTDWSFSAMVLENQPFEDDNDTDTTITASGLTGSVTLTSSANLFSSPMVGSSFKLDHVEPRSSDEATISTTQIGGISWSSATSYTAGDIVFDVNDHFTCISDYTGGAGGDPITDFPSNFSPGIVARDSDGVDLSFDVRGEWSFRTEGTWTGEWGIQESDDGGTTWITRYAMSSEAGSDNYLREGDETSDPLMIRVVLFSGAANSAPVTFVRQEVTRSGEALITAYTSATQVTATVQKDFFATTATTLWAENEWNPRKGYPKQVFFKNNRLCFAATPAEGQAIWGSEVDQWNNFKRGSLEDTEPFKDVLRTGNQDPIRWVSEQSQSLLGLSSQIRNFTSEDGSSALAPGRNNSARQAGRGAADLEPVEVDDFTFYVQAGGRIIRGLSNDYERGVFAAPDMTREAEHVTQGGVKQMAFQLNRVSTLYAVTGTGEVACLIFDPEIEKMGWYRLTTQNGIIESVAVLPTTGEEDEVYFVVKRVIDGATVRYVERMRTDQVRVQDAGIQDDMFFLDCGGTVEGSDMTEITGLSHLEGEVIQVLGDGDYLGTFTVTSGAVTIPSCDKASYGLPISAKLWPMPLEGITASGTTSGSQKRVHEITIDVLNTLGLETKSSPDDTNDPQSLTPRRESDDLESSPLLYTGKLEVRTALPRSYDGNVFYQSEIPFGVFIRNIITKWEKTS